MRTPEIERVKVGDYYVYTTEIESIKRYNEEQLINDLWSEEYLGRNLDEDGNLIDQGPGIHASLQLWKNDETDDDEELPYFFKDAYYFAKSFACSLRALQGKSLNILNKTAWIIAAQDEHTPYWHTHRLNILDPRNIPEDGNHEGIEQSDATYSYSFYINTPECGSPFSDLLFAHKEDVFSMPISAGKLCFFDGDVFHKPQLVPKEFGWRYCIAGDFLFED
jgi:hypothetical protein